MGTFLKKYCLLLFLLLPVVVLAASPYERKGSRGIMYGPGNNPHFTEPAPSYLMPGTYDGPAPAPQEEPAPAKETKPAPPPIGKILFYYVSAALFGALLLLGILKMLKELLEASQSADFFDPQKVAARITGQAIIGGMVSGALLFMLLQFLGRGDALGFHVRAALIQWLGWLCLFSLGEIFLARYKNRPYRAQDVFVWSLTFAGLFYSAYTLVSMVPASFRGTIEEKLYWYPVAALFGAFMGAFFSEKLAGYRKILWALLAIFILVSALYINTGLGASICFGFSAYWAFKLLKLPHGSKKEKDLYTFGSAKWADLEYLTERAAPNSGLSLGETGGILSDGKGVFLGYFKFFKNAWETAVKEVSYVGDRHLLTVAPTRSGKGVTAIIPNLLNYRGSALVIDPKGENAIITAEARQEMGQDVFVVDPWGITDWQLGPKEIKKATYNPLDFLRRETATEDAMMLADALIIPSSHSTEGFWDDEAKALLMGIMLFVAFDPIQDGFGRDLARVRDIICFSSAKDGPFMDIMRLMSSSDIPAVASTAERTIGKDEKLRNGVLATLQAHTHFLDSPAIRESLSRTSFSFEDLKTKRGTVYLVLPSDRLNTFSRWLRLLIQQSITLNARNIHKKPELPILFILDEMAALGRLSMVEQAYGLMAGFGMQLWGIVQDLSQLENIYGKAWQTFIGNSGVLQYFGSRDHQTASYFSHLCGMQTIKTFSLSKTFQSVMPSSSGPGSSSSSSTTNTNESQRPLIYPDELMRIIKERQLLLIENLNPIIGARFPWFEHPILASLGVNLHKEEDPPQEELGLLPDPTFWEKIR